MLGTRGSRRDSCPHYLLIKYFLGRLGSELIRRPSPKPSGQVPWGQDAPAPEPNHSCLCLHKASAGRARQKGSSSWLSWAAAATTTTTAALMSPRRCGAGAGGCRGAALPLGRPKGELRASAGRRVRGQGRAAGGLSGFLAGRGRPEGGCFQKRVLLSAEAGGPQAAAGPRLKGPRMKMRAGRRRRRGCCPRCAGAETPTAARPAEHLWVAAGEQRGGWGRAGRRERGHLGA